MLKALLITIGFTLAAVRAVPFSPYAEDKCGECKANGTMVTTFSLNMLSNLKNPAMLFSLVTL